MHVVSCTKIHHDAIDLVNHGMFKNTKSGVSWERYITFLRNKKIFNLAWDEKFWEIIVLLAEVTFMNWMQKTLDTIIFEKQKLLKIEYFYTFLLFVT